MRVTPMILALTLGIVMAPPAVAGGFSFSAQVGSVRIGASGGRLSYGAGYGRSGYGAGVVASKGYGKGIGGYWGERRRYQKYYKHYRPKRWPYRGIYLYGRRNDDRPRYRDPPPPAAPPPPVVAAPVEPPPPPDPRGPLRSSPARGILPAGPAYTIGEALPRGLPHVTLDWRQFDLAEPPPGQIYARVKSDVLLITATGRVVKSVVPPG
jgi:Nickel/cobalt transporter regulator